MTNKLAVAVKRHPLHSLCSYLGCFPPHVPRTLLQRLPQGPGVILDPFCGSGTTLLESHLLGRACVGIDLNPLAVALSTAKIQSVKIEEVEDRLTELRQGFSPCSDHDDDDAERLQTFFHPRTLSQLRYLRDAFDLSRPEDLFLRGAVLGIMHGKHRRGEPEKDGYRTAYLSIDMPNTFSMSVSYVKGYVAKHKLKQPAVDVFAQLSKRSNWLLRDGAAARPKGRSTVIQGDATLMPQILSEHGIPRVAAIITSPPYLGILRYGAFNWIRLWFLRADAAQVDRTLDGTDSMDRYLGFMASFMRSAAEILKPGDPMALVIGDVDEFGSSMNLAKRVWDEVGGLVPFELEGRILQDQSFDPSAKTTRIWGEGKKGRATDIDRVLVMRRVSRQQRAAIRKVSGVR